MSSAQRKVEFDGVLRLTRSVNHSLRCIPTGDGERALGCAASGPSFVRERVLLCR